MSCLTIGCVGVLVAFPVALAIAVIVAVKAGRQQAILDGVNLERLSATEQRLWSAYREQLGRHVCLSAQQERVVRGWARRR